MYSKLALMLIIAGLLWGCSNEGGKETYSDSKADENNEIVQDDIDAARPEEGAAENVYVEIFFHDSKWRELVGLGHLRVNGELTEPTALEPSTWHKGSVSISIPAAARLEDEDIGARLAESDAIEIQAIHAENKAVLASEYVRFLDYVQDSLQS